jgi:hypothetical protein
VESSSEEGAVVLPIKTFEVFMFLLCSPRVLRYSNLRGVGYGSGDSCLDNERGFVERIIEGSGCIVPRGTIRESGSEREVFHVEHAGVIPNLVLTQNGTAAIKNKNQPQNP